jgi:hypothetical protein
VASVAILAKATPGQGHIIKDILKSIVEARDTLRVPVHQDILQIIDYVYEHAGLKLLRVVLHNKYRSIIN